MVRLGKREGLVGVGQICQKCVQAFSTRLILYKTPEVKTISVTYASVFKDLIKGSPKARWVVVQNGRQKSSNAVDSCDLPKMNNYFPPIYMDKN